MFLTPDQTPFFGARIFPKTAPRLPGFVELLRDRAAYRKRAIGQQGEALRATSRKRCRRRPWMPHSATPLDTELRELKQLFDETDGGIGAAPSSAPGRA